MIQWKSAGTTLYQQLPQEMFLHWEACESLTELPGEEQPRQKL